MPLTDPDVSPWRGSTSLLEDGVTAFSTSGNFQGWTTQEIFQFHKLQEEKKNWISKGDHSSSHYPTLLTSLDPVAHIQIKECPRVCSARQNERSYLPQPDLPHTHTDSTGHFTIWTLTQSESWLYSFLNSMFWVLKVTPKTASDQLARTNNFNQRQTAGSTNTEL